MALTVGQKAPDFDVVSASGRRLKLSELLGKKNVVLYFYPADFTPVCTKETCGFRDMYEELASKDTEVIGVSVDSDEQHRKFAEKHAVPFDLVSDGERALARAYGATGFLRDLLGKAARITYVIDKKGVIVRVLKAELSAGTHLDGVRDAVATLS
jgi:thioredoxin-dependent peroxiredoxin